MGENGSETVICRTCLNFIESAHKATSIDENTELSNGKKVLIKELIRMCISEMDLSLCDNAVVCESCKNLLKNTYLFKIKCLQSEERIYSYIEENNLGVGVKINLSNLLGHNDNEEVVLVSDSDSVQEIRFTECNVDRTVINQTNGENNINIGNNVGQSSTYIPQLGKYYLCGKCYYRTDKKHILTSHIRYFCKYRSHTCKCNQRFNQCPRKNNLIRRPSIRSNKGPYICGICGKQAINLKNIRLHILYKHSLYKHSVPELLMPYKCGMEDCNEIFNRKFDFNSHIVKHFAYKPFVCRLCMKVFFNATQWNDHMENIHGLS